MKKVFEGAIDDSVHQQFVRFGKGIYPGRAQIGLWKTKKIKMNSGFEYCNDIVRLISEFDVKFQGLILSKEKIEGLSGNIKSGKYVYEVNDFTSEQIKKIMDNVYYFLLDGEGDGIKLVMKKKLPKPGKSEGKIDNKFCKLELDEKYFNKIKDSFLWDVSDSVKRVKISHIFQIDSIVMPKSSEKDFAKIREMAKRKGKIVRILDIESKEERKEIEFEA